MLKSNVLLPQGGLGFKHSVYILGIYQSDLYALVKGTLSSDVVMVKVYTNSSSSNVLNPALSAITPFTLSYMGDSLVFTTLSGMHLASSSGVMMLSSTIEPIYFSQDTYTMFGTPSLILSSVPYTAFDDANELQVKLQDGSTVTMPVLVVPTSYFSGCSVGNSLPISSVQKVMDTTYCSHFSQSWCIGADGEAWVDQADCLEGNTYTYCANGVSCSGNCKSGCFDSIANEVCVFESGSYVCMEESGINVNVSAAPPPEPIDTGINWWWIILIVIAIIIVIGLLVWIAYRNRRQPDYYQHHEYLVHHEG